MGAANGARPGSPHPHCGAGKKLGFGECRRVYTARDGDDGGAEDALPHCGDDGDAEDLLPHCGAKGDHGGARKLHGFGGRAR